MNLKTLNVEREQFLKHFESRKHGQIEGENQATERLKAAKLPAEVPPTDLEQTHYQQRVPRIFKFGPLGRSYGHTNSVLRFLFIRSSGFGLIYPTRLC